jgi:hypothetical protein
MNIISCPYPECGIHIEIIELNCRIFRCGVLKTTGQQIPPHSTKAECQAYRGQIYGCGQPFRVQGEAGNYVSEVCAYI